MLLFLTIDYRIRLSVDISLLCHKCQHVLEHPIYEGVDSSKVQLFFAFYFTMTGMHALHMIIGLGVLVVLVIQAWGGKFSPEYNAPVDMTGLYWHFVDIVWIFLFPLLYLIGRHMGQH